MTRPFAKNIAWKIIVLFFLSLSTSAAEFRRGENVDVSGQFSDLLFLSGQRIESNVRSSNDVFMAGGNITFSGGGAENLFAAGGNIDLLSPKVRLAVLAGGNLNLSQVRTDDLILAAGKVRVDQSQVANNALLAGGQIDIGRDTVIQKSTVLAGRLITFAGTAQGDVDISGREIYLTGNFLRNVNVRAEKIVLGPDARIAGNFTHASRILQISPSAQVLGQNEPLPLGSEQASTASRTAAVFLGLLFLLGTLLGPALIAILFPNFIVSAQEHLRMRFLENLGKGTLALLITPALLILLFTTVIGVPVALFSLPFLAVAFLTGWSVAVFFVGHQLRLWIHRIRAKTLRTPEPWPRRQIFAWTLLGALLIAMILFIPLLGALFSFLLLLASLGAIYSQMRGTPTSHESRSPSASGWKPIGAQV